MARSKRPLSEAEREERRTAQRKELEQALAALLAMRASNTCSHGGQPVLGEGVEDDMQANFAGTGDESFATASVNAGGE